MNVLVVVASLVLVDICLVSLYIKLIRDGGKEGSEYGKIY